MPADFWIRFVTAYDNPEHAERRLEIDRLDREIDNLKADRQSIANRLIEWSGSVEDAEPFDVEQISGEIETLLKEFKEWGLKLNDAERERREYD